MGSLDREACLPKGGIVKKAGIIVYPQFSLQEISCLTELFKFNGKEITVFSSTLDVVKSEDGFSIVPDKVFSKFDKELYDCIVLPGLWDYRCALNNDAIIEFLKRFKDDININIGSISSSPILLAKAGILDDRKFCAGLYEEVIDKYEFIPRKNLVRKPIYEDRNLITALGFAYREFAISVARKVGIQCSNEEFKGIIKEDYKDEELIFHTNMDYKEL